jgi:hypothetical protein
MKDMTYRWLTLQPPSENGLTDNDAEGSVDGNAGEVTDAMESMILEEGFTSGQSSHFVGDLKPSKRKRTSSQPSPPKVSHLFILIVVCINVPQKDGGRGPVKRRRDSSVAAIPSISPVQSTSDEYGFLVSPVGRQASSISHGSSSHHDTSLLDPWDDDTMNNDPSTQHSESTSQLEGQMQEDNDIRHAGHMTQPLSREGSRSQSSSASPVDISSESSIILVPDSESTPPLRTTHSPTSLPPLDDLDAHEDMTRSSSMPLPPLPARDDLDAHEDIPRSSSMPLRPSSAADSTPSCQESHADQTTDPRPDDVYAVSLWTFLLTAY